MFIHCVALSSIYAFRSTLKIFLRKQFIEALQKNGRRGAPIYYVRIINPAKGTSLTGSMKYVNSL